MVSLFEDASVCNSNVIVLLFHFIMDVKLKYHVVLSAPYFPCKEGNEEDYN